MSKFKKTIRETWASIRGDAAYDIVKWVVIYLVVPSVSTWLIYLRGKVIGWFANATVIYTIVINVLVFIAIFSMIYGGIKLTSWIVRHYVSRSFGVKSTSDVAVESVDLAKLEYVTVIVPHTNDFGDHVETYAGIRVDGLQSKGVRAKLVNVVSDRGGKLNMNEINPTNNDLAWDIKYNPNIIKIVSERGKDTKFLFSKRVYSECINIMPGTYTLEVEIIAGLKKITMVETLNVKVPNNGYRYHKTGLRWTESPL
jgi:hypothetical protein